MPDDVNHLFCLLGLSLHAKMLISEELIMLIFVESNTANLLRELNIPFCTLQFSSVTLLPISHVQKLLKNCLQLQNLLADKKKTLKIQNYWFSCNKL